MQLALANRLSRAGSEPPAFSLDLLQSPLDSRLTFSRASTATDVINNTLTSFAADTPRQSAANGLLIEEARTNSLRNAAATGTVNGVLGSGGTLPTQWALEVNGGLTTEVIASGTQNGFPYVRLKISGTPTATSWQLRCESNTQIAASLAHVWSSSVYVRQQAGSLTNISAVDWRLVELNSSGTYLNATDTSLTLSSSFTRTSNTRTLTEATVANVNVRLRLQLTIGQPIDITLDIAAPQLELGAFPTSFISTTSAAATRAADLCTLATISSWFNTNEGTLMAEGRPQGLDPAAASSARLVRFDSGGSVGLHELRRNPADSTLRAGTTTSSLVQSALTHAVWANGTTARAVYAYKQNDMAGCLAGGSVQTDTTSPDGMPACTVLRLGQASATSGFWNGYLRGVRYWSRRLTNDQLKAVTL